MQYYLLCVSQLLPLKGKEKRSVLSFIKNNLQEYIGERSHISIQQINAGFGTPEEVAKEYGFDEESTKKKFLASRPILKIVLCALGGIAALFVVYFLVSFLLYHMITTVPFSGYIK